MHTTHYVPNGVKLESTVNYFVLLQNHILLHLLKFVVTVLTIFIATHVKSSFFVNNCNNRHVACASLFLNCIIFQLTVDFDICQEKGSFTFSFCSMCWAVLLSFAAHP